MELIFFIISSVFIFLSIIGTGMIFLNKYHVHDFFFISLIGYFFLGLLALLLHFFYNISDLISLIFLFIGIFIFIFKFHILNKKDFLKLILVYLIFLFILIGYSQHAIDAQMYHHPYVSYLNSEKIIFAISNIQFRFGHISFLQYVQSIVKNNFLHELTLVIPNIILFTTFIFFSFKNIFENKNNKKLLITVIIFFNCFILVKYGRYREFGNDLIPLLVASYFMFKIIDQLIYNFKTKFNLIQIFPIYLTFMFAHKITYIFSSLIFLAVFNKNNLKKYIKFDYYILIFLIFLFSWSSKNFINTSCFVYPLVESCVKGTSWYLSGLADPINASFLSEIWAKGFIDHENWKSLNLQEYVKSFNWLSTWLNGHFIKILEKISPLLIAMLLTLFFIYYIQRNQNYKLNYNSKNSKNILFLLICIFVGLLVWFFKAPLFRYGTFYIISFVVLLYLYFTNHRISKLKLKNFNKIRMIFLICLLIFIVKNIDRQIKSEKSFFPLTKISIDNYSNVGSDVLIILKPKKGVGVCNYTNHVCSHETSDKVRIGNLRNYYLIK